MATLSPIEASMRETIADLYEEYADSLDEGPLERWPRLFTEDCSYRIVPRENYALDLPLAVMRCDSRAMLEDRVLATTKLSVYAPRTLRHIISQVRIVGEEHGELLTRANYAVFQTRGDGRTTIFNVGRYMDRIRRDPVELRFSEKLCVFDTVLVPNSIVAPI
jgi:anthranilate 1,2-dioxygenase small subunit